MYISERGRMALPLYLILMVYYKYLNRFKGAAVALMQPPPFYVHKKGGKTIMKVTIRPP